jgi:CRP-like cAMP-binding protein
MTIQCQHCPLRRKDLFADMTLAEIETIQRFKAGELVVEPGAQILVEGSTAPQLYTVLSGLGIREKKLHTGDRQVINFLFPGDFIGLQASVMGEMNHTVEARTPMRLCVFNRSEFWDFCKKHPNRAYDMTWMSAIEEHFLGETLAALGQRSALQSMAWALMRIYQRGAALGMVRDSRMTLPYTQRDMADALGLSLVHTNKTLGKLKERELALWSDQVLHIPDLDALAAVAEMPAQAPRLRPLL